MTRRLGNDRAIASPMVPLEPRGFHPEALFPHAAGRVLHELLREIEGPNYLSTMGTMRVTRDGAEVAFFPPVTGG